VAAGAGVVMLAKPGDEVREGQPLLELHTDDPALFGRALEALDGGYDIGYDIGGDYSAPQLIIDRID
jgi:thymidine phosphorylase